jgi:tRNA-specific 2-thiouridylase
MSERWVVAMSGGVDSSVAAALLVRRGLDVVGITMDIGGDALRDLAEDGATGRRTGKCCGLPDAEDARSVASALGIRHYVANYRDAFRRAVIDPFVDGYLEGSTPIPCIACNRELKFDKLLQRSHALGGVGVATGHYARLAPGPDGEPALYRPRDREKDQTYFLFDLARETLSRLAFPLGDLEKREVRELARELALVTAEKPESQGICFVPDGDVRAALQRLRPGIGRACGEIVDGEGRVLGRHQGAVGYTRGQRRGLGLSGGPWYVSRVEPRANRLTVDRAPGLLRRELVIERPSWLAGELPRAEVRVQVRHRHRSVSARIEPLDGEQLRICCAAPVWAPAPGQAAVVYDRDDERLLGGGWIAGAA